MKMDQCKTCGAMKIKDEFNRKGRKVFLLQITLIKRKVRKAIFIKLCELCVYIKPYE